MEVYPYVCSDTNVCWGTSIPSVGPNVVLQSGQNRWKFRWTPAGLPELPYILMAAHLLAGGRFLCVGRVPLEETLAIVLISIYRLNECFFPLARSSSVTLISPLLA